LSTGADETGQDTMSCRVREVNGPTGRMDQAGERLWVRPARRGRVALIEEEPIGHSSLGPAARPALGRRPSRG